MRKREAAEHHKHDMLLWAMGVRRPGKGDKPPPPPEILKPKRR